ncbi:MAG TPA: hypothetical protein VIO64_05000 [Pseudobacteroides sp.]|uniref:hypothetical protein n=1 Tax=Pseudobacteroides sp. TaxID=1968840 RepID=UPI002F942C82
MDYIQRFPFIISAIMAIVIGAISYTAKDDLKQTCIKMTIALIVFYIIGTFIRSVFYSIHEEIVKRREEMEKEKDKDMEPDGLDNQEVSDSSAHDIDFTVDE